MCCGGRSTPSALHSPGAARSGCWRPAAALQPRGWGGVKDEAVEPTALRAVPGSPTGHGERLVCAVWEKHGPELHWEGKWEQSGGSSSESPTLRLYRGVYMLLRTDGQPQRADSFSEGIRKRVVVPAAPNHFVTKLREAKHCLFSPSPALQLGKRPQVGCTLP